jgi:hypothetical protein
MTMISDEPPGPPLKLNEDMCLVGIDVAGWPDRAKFSIENLDRRRCLDRWLSFLTLPPGDIPDPLLRTLEDSWLDKAAAALGRRRGHRR